MLDMGFYDDVSEIISHTKDSRKMLLFSATMTKDVKHLASEFMDDAVYIGGEDEETPASISHDYLVSQHDDKMSFLMRYIDQYNPGKAIIFSNTKSGASKLSSTLRRQGYQAVQLHGDLTQKQREDSIARFRKKERFLIATDVAARGVDIPAITHIINYDMPREDKTYIHRVGRTARFGNDGTAMSIILPDEKYILDKIERIANIKINKLPMDGQAEEMRDRGNGNRRYGGGQRRYSSHSSGRGSNASSGRKPYRPQTRSRRRRD
jgi:Superfamily II DNA and RNA helicases